MLPFQNKPKFSFFIFNKADKNNRSKMSAP